jgi:hypothetical protein
MRAALADFWTREISPFALAPVFGLLLVMMLWVPIRLSIGDAAWATAIVVKKYVTYADGAPMNQLGYSFIVDGREFTGSAWVLSEVTYGRTNVGDPLPVRYAGGDPSVNRYVAEFFFTTGEAAFAALVLLLICVAAGGVVESTAA